VKHSITIALAAAASLGLAGCTSLTQAGHASYTVRSFTGPNGQPSCCELQVSDGKEFEGRRIQFQTTGGAAALVVQEGDSKAFKGQAISGKALSVLPVTSLPDILK
jgi:hypothetical protein